MMPRVLRALAILIAIVAVIDPAVTSTRTTRPEVAVITADSAKDAALAGRVARELGERFTVIPAPFAPAAATVLIGTRLPTALATSSATFAVAPEPATPSATIVAVDAPSRTNLDARVPITTTVHALGANGRDVEVTLSMGSAVIDRVTERVADGDERLTVSLGFVPTVVGAARVTLSSRITDADAPDPTPGATADLVIDVRDDRWSVLFFDPRASWMSTFVRRTVERDPRFAVTSRVVTSRNVSIDAGRPPATLGDANALAAFDAIVVGAAQTLAERDVAGLEAYLRQRGGSVILLLDERASGPFDRLTRVRQWSSGTEAAGFAISSVEDEARAARDVSSDSTLAELRATSLLWPSTLPAGARELARAHPAVSVATPPRPAIWRIQVGAGELVVSGALDAWRHRDPAMSRFDEYWRETLATAAAAGASPIEVTMPSSIVAPGERVEIATTVRSLALADAPTTSIRDSVIASIDAPGGASTVRLWPDGSRGRFRGSFRAPVTEGMHRITVASSELRADVPLLVSATATPAAPNDSDLVAAWVASRGGQVIQASALGELGPALQRTLRPTARRETWYPMRSAWWIVPFALLLGAEWLWRRRNGLA